MIKKGLVPTSNSDSPGCLVGVRNSIQPHTKVLNQSVPTGILLLNWSAYLYVTVTVQKYCMHCKPGMQTRPEEDCSACTKCRVQSQTICCSYHANTWPSHDCSNFQFWQDGLHRCKKVHTVFISVILQSCFCIVVL